MLALPGSAYLYQGEELGLPEHTTLPDDVPPGPDVVPVRRPRARGRDGCRVPIPWARRRAGRTASGRPERRGCRSRQSLGRVRRRPAAACRARPYEIYRAALRLRKELQLGHAELAWSPGADTVAFTTTTPGGTVAVLANLGAAPVPAPAGEVLLASGDLVDGQVPTDVTVWVRQ